ncbi:IGF-like family receptor 1 isoform X2 [Betta splendens]|uniref:IGF-like family receptor 1 isoform X2 n=1 Tax=Betta splendens TaxID=158456 RepID=A0A6P7KTC7_BETSP|nr:IGF-like family receptor 1 isoform X2 [Betta splendens]
MGHSTRCRDPKTHWDGSSGTCVRCSTLAGYYVTPNCGYDDDGFSRHDVPYRPCNDGTFNSDNNSAVCRPCTVCPSGQDVSSKCTTTTDTRCSPVPRAQTTSPTTSQGSTSTPTPTTVPLRPVATGLDQTETALLAIGVSFLLLLAVCIIFILRKKGRRNSTLRYNKRPSIVEEGFSPLFTADGNNDLEQIFSPGVLSAPLQTVLDNLDVLEQLVILLDPETHGVKNTKHLASRCSFSSSWVTYTYSMKESKSPLKAVLEGVTTRHPDWTVGHLAKLLRLMERNDAVTVLAKLRLTSMPTVQPTDLQNYF